jgi:hypothetical protein
MEVPMVGVIVLVIGGLIVTSFWAVVDAEKDSE